MKVNRFLSGTTSDKARQEIHIVEKPDGDANGHDEHCPAFESLRHFISPLLNLGWAKLKKVAAKLGLLKLGRFFLTLKIKTL